MEHFKQSLSMYALVVPHMSQRLDSAIGFVKKAAKHAEQNRYPVERLYTARLYPDMHDFTMQIKLVSESVKLSISQLTADESPKWPDLEPTEESLLARLTLAKDYLKACSAELLEGSEAREIELDIPMGPVRKLNFSGFSFHTEYVIPQLLFHLTCAHAILRHNGVKIGKLDFMGVV